LMEERPPAACRIDVQLVRMKAAIAACGGIELAAVFPLPSGPIIRVANDQDLLGCVLDFEICSISP